jgi:uncharacterized coiled-coil protein SlyX
MFTSQSTIERRTAKEKRLAEIEGRINVLENASTVTSPLETRMVTLESMKPIDLSPLETRIATLESKPAPVVDFSPLESRLVALETKPAHVVDFSPLESRLVALETTLKTLETTLKTLSANQNENTDDIRKRLEEVESNAANIRKELDEMKAAAAKKPSTGGFTNATTTPKNFAFPAKKKEESTD